MSLPKTQRAALNDIIKNEVINQFTPQGLASGVTLKQVESKLGNIASKQIRSDDYHTNQLGFATKEVQESLRRMVGRVNGQQVQEKLDKINEGWANFKRIQAASVAAGSKEGVFTPSQYLRAVKSLNRTRDNSAFARGAALNQDLADAAKSKMVQTVPDSGTPFRSILATLGLGGAGHFISPTIPLTALVVGTPYVSPKLTQALLTGSPEGRKMLADSFRKGIPYLAPSAGAAAAAQKADSQ